jgi:hypothetical protein
MLPVFTVPYLYDGLELHVVAGCSQEGHEVDTRKAMLVHQISK